MDFENMLKKNFIEREHLGGLLKT